MANLAENASRVIRWLRRSPLYLAGAAAATPMVSIAAYQILLGAAILALLVNIFVYEDRGQLRWPSASLPLLGFIGWTLVSLAASPDPHSGLPQLKKLYVFTMLFVVFIALRKIEHALWVARAWVAGATLSAVWALLQYVRMSGATPAEFFYHLYSNQGRITGFMTVWMTFSGLTMIAILAAIALLLFSPRSSASRSRWGGTDLALIVALAILSAALLLGFQRSMWAGTAVGAMWLLGSRNKWLALLIPVIAVAIIAANPFRIGDRAMAALHPQAGVLDSAAHRRALRATGWEMIKAHPIFGVGPEQVKVRFLEYAPDSVPRPIPVEWYIGHLHNIYYQFAAERGLPALAFLLWFLGKCLYDFLRSLRELPKGKLELPYARALLHTYIAVILAVMVAGYWEHNLGDSEVLGLFLAAVGCGYVVRACVMGGVTNAHATLA